MQTIKALKCTDCAFITENESVMLAHIEATHGKKWKCSRCGYRGETKDMVQVHITAAHGLQREVGLWNDFLHCVGKCLAFCCVRRNEMTG